MHFGLAAAKRDHRAQVLAEAFAKHPERFPNGVPLPKALPTAVWINPPVKRDGGSAGASPLTRESSEDAIVDPGATSKADPEAEGLASVGLTPEVGAYFGA